MGNLWATRPAFLPILRAYTPFMSILKPGVTTHPSVRAIERSRTAAVLRVAGSSAEWTKVLRAGRQAAVATDGRVQSPALSCVLPSPVLQCHIHRRPFRKLP